MADTVHSIPTPMGESQANFGVPPGSANAVAECEKWEKLCADLLAERQKLRAELGKAQFERDQYSKTVAYFMSKDYACPYSSEELLSFVDSQPPLHELIAELERNAENRG